jgi:hypothetical protein
LSDAELKRPFDLVPAFQNLFADLDDRSGRRASGIEVHESPLSLNGHLDGLIQRKISQIVQRYALARLGREREAPENFKRFSIVLRIIDEHVKLLFLVSVVQHVDERDRIGNGRMFRRSEDDDLLCSAAEKSDIFQYSRRCVDEKHINIAGAAVNGVQDIETLEFRKRRMAGGKYIDTIRTDHENILEQIVPV